MSQGREPIARPRRGLAADDPGGGEPAPWRGGGRSTPLRRRPWLIAAALATVGAAGAVFAGMGAARRWLAGRAEHRVGWDDSRLVLEPPPPPWIRSGAAGIRAGARRRLGDAPTISLLEPDWPALASAFALGSPWVAAVRRMRVVGYPNRLVVELEYREPVARVGKARPVVIDGQGVALPTDDLDIDAAGALVRLVGWGEPGAARHGVGLAPPDSPAERRLRAGAALATFIRERSDGGEPLLVSVDVAGGERQLLARTASGLWVAWGDPPGQEAPGTPSADAKWRMLRDWLASHAPPSPDSAGPLPCLLFGRDAATVRYVPRAGGPGDSGPGGG